MSIKVLETNRLYIREFTHDDYHDAHALYSNHQNMKYIGDGKPFTMKQTEIFIDKMIKRYIHDGYSFWAVVDKNKNIIIGHCGLMRHKETNKIEIGYLINEPYIGKGFAYEISKEVINYAFRCLDVSDVVAFTKKVNIPSQSLMNKLKMKHWKDYSKEGIEYTAYKITKSYFYCDI